MSGFDQLELFGGDAAEQAAVPPPSPEPGQGRRPARRRYVPEWEREQRRLAAYRRRARAGDGEPWSVDECWPLFRPSLERYLETRRRERGEAR